MHSAKNNNDNNKIRFINTLLHQNELQCVYNCQTSLIITKSLQAIGTGLQDLKTTQSSRKS